MNKYKNRKLLTIFLPNSNSMHLGAHDDHLVSSLKSSNNVLVITKSRRLKKIFQNNIKINVIECESQIGDYLISNNCFDSILILSNKNTKDIIEYIKK